MACFKDRKKQQRKLSKIIALFVLFLCLLQLLAHKIFEDYIYFILGGNVKPIIVICTNKKKE